MEGSRTVNRPVDEVKDRLTLMLGSAGADFTVEDESGAIRFSHGTYLTQTVGMLPKTGTLQLRPENGKTRVVWEVRPTLFIRIWLTFFGVAFFWLIFPPIVAYLALVRHPGRFVDSILNGL